MTGDTGRGILDQARRWGCWLVTDEGGAEDIVERPKAIHTCHVCVNVYCAEGGSQTLKQALEERLASSPVEVKEYVCFGACTMGPNIVLYPEGTWYMGVQPADLDEIIGHIEGGAPVKRLTERVEPVLHEIILEIIDAGLD